MKNILYIVKREKSGCNYYDDTILYLKKKANVKICKEPFISSIENEGFNANCIVIGFDVTNCSDNKPNLNMNNDLHLPLYIILNKEYTGLENKLNWIKEMNPRLCFSVHHDVEIYQKYTNIPFKRIMWSANDNIFKKYDEDYKYDLFFSGVMRKEQTNNLRYKIYQKKDEIKDYNLKLDVLLSDNGKIIFKTNKKDYNYSNEEYAKIMNHSKICLVTTGPADLVGTRYFEISASQKAMILCNRMSKKIYEDMLIDGFNCVMFDDENDFIEKFKYYIHNEKERLQIVNNAYNHFINNLTWDHQINNIICHL